MMETDRYVIDLLKRVKASEIVPLSPPPVHDAEWFSEQIAEAQEKAWHIGDAPIFGSAKWFEDVPEVKY